MKAATKKKTQFLQLFHKNFSEFIYPEFTVSFSNTPTVFFPHKLVCLTPNDEEQKVPLPSGPYREPPLSPASTFLEKAYEKSKRKYS